MKLDVLLLPGGIPVDESVVRIPGLWRPDGAPLAPEALHVDLVPVHHVPGYDVVDAAVQLDYVLWRHRARSSCRSSVQVSTTIVDREAVRPPFWDLGVSAPNLARSRWLALYDSASGAFRAVFDSPNAALRVGPLGEP